MYNNVSNFTKRGLVCMSSENLYILPGEKVETYFQRLSTQGYVAKETYQSVDIHNIEFFLKILGRYTNDTFNAVRALLDNELPSSYAKIASSHHFSDGARTSQIGAYMGYILEQSGKQKDREGRDYWLKPLEELGVLEPIKLDGNAFIKGHTAKSPNNSYRLTNSFIELMLNPNLNEELIKDWTKKNSLLERTHITVETTQLNEELSKTLNKHQKLIENSINIYAKNYLEGYICLYKDDSDGDRISEMELKLLNTYNVKLGELGDVWPDVVFYNPTENSLWFIEAVTTDGEVDIKKLQGFIEICRKSNKKFGGCTTTYDTWNTFSRRQSKVKNLVPNSYVWINEDPEKQFFVI